MGYTTRDGFPDNGSAGICSFQELGTFLAKTGQHVVDWGGIQHETLE